MSNIWKPRPPSFPSDDKIPFTAAEVNEFYDSEDLNIRNNARNESLESDVNETNEFHSRLYRARDSVFIRQKKRNSVLSNNYSHNSDEEPNDDSHSARNVRFSNILLSNDGVDNEGFEEEENNQLVLNRMNSFEHFSDQQNESNLDTTSWSEDIEGRRESEISKGWDIFKTLPPPDEDESLDSDWVGFFIKFLKIFVYILTFVVVLGSAVLSKSLILLMTSMVRINRTIPLCSDKIYSTDPELEYEKSYKVIYREDDPERIAWLWCLFFAVITPDVFALGRSFRICFFKTYKIPNKSTFYTVLCFESLYSIGISLLVFLILPSLDVIKGSMMTNSLCLVPGLLLLLKSNEYNAEVKHLDPNQSKKLKHNENYSKLLTFLGTVGQVTGLIVWPVIAYYDNSDYYWCQPLALVLISFSWWENFINHNSNNIFVKHLLNVKKDLKSSRYFTYALVSVWKMFVIFVSMIIIIYFKEGYPALKTTFAHFWDTFTTDTIEIIRDFQNDENLDKENSHIMTITDPLIPVWILLIQMSCTYLCYAFAKFSCKIHIQTFSFAVPVNLVVPFTVSFLWIMAQMSAEDKCQLCHFFNGFQYIFWFTSNKNGLDFSNNWIDYTIVGLWAISLASQIVIAIHIWSTTSARLASTEELFINPMYSSVVIDQSLAMNRRRVSEKEGMIIEDEESPKKSNEDINGNYYETVNEPVTMNDPSPITDPVKHIDSDATIRIFVCATMWHENKEEMIQMLKAVMRLDEDQCSRKNAQHFFGVSPLFTEYYEIEFNVYFDDAFDQGDTDAEDDRVINRFVKNFIETMDEAASNVHGMLLRLKKPIIVPTPYGGRLEWTLPGQNKLIAHLKDKTLIRHRKRWSQCMYMYHLLGHRIAELEIHERRKEIIANNTYILALDGDINFRPHALHLIVDLMKKNPRLGAACGRIHPIGTGPIVWYQKFEYAIGHWLQKATEHVFGCVLCSPGCFSLFRARAVMDDSVMNKYTTPPSEALHYVQYDQGEDRWLCTLLLQQGWRIEYSAASDSYTHAPEGFGEFYTQRRRWAPSTMANIMDLLGNYKRTIRKNSDISMLYVIYQGMLLLGTILSPGTIFLMVIGSMNTVMNFDTEISLAINIVPVLFFAIICLVFKDNDNKILVAMILSTVYALLMLAVLVGIGIEMSGDGPWTPNSIFFIGMIGSFIVAAIIHPQEFACVLPLFLYLLLIPSMYLLLTVYSVTNMNIVTWGTREVKSKLTAKEQAAQDEAEAEAAKTTKSKTNFLKYLDFNKTGLFTCLCCSTNRSDEDSAKLNEIGNQLMKMNENISHLKTNIEPEPKYRRNSTLYRRKSFGNRDQSETISLPTTVPEEDEEEDDDEDQGSIDENTSLLAAEKKHKIIVDDPMWSPNRPTWARDVVFKRFPFQELTTKEKEFWDEFIPKYLKPLDENLKEKERIANDLKELRNKAVFAFGIINIIFILFVYLLQMHKDVFGIEIPAGIHNYSHVYNEELDKFEDIPEYKYIRMDPIGLVLILFFGTIMIIQIIGMFMHRFGTLAHLLAFTSIDFFDKRPKNINEKFDENFNRSAVRLTKQIQKLGVNDIKEMDNSAIDSTSNRRPSIFARPQSTQPLDLNEAFRRRIMSFDVNSNDLPDFQGLRRKSLGQVLINRRNTVDWRRISIVPESILKLRSDTYDSSRSPSIASYTPRAKCLSFQMDEKPMPSHSGEQLKATAPVNPRVETLHVTLNAVSDDRPPTGQYSGHSLLTVQHSGLSQNSGHSQHSDDRPPTGQHTIASYNVVQQNVAKDLSENIITNTLNEMKTLDPIEGTSSSEPPIKQEVLAQVHSTDSSNSSTVSSNIDFNFEAFEESDNNDSDFPMTTFQPTVVQISGQLDNLTSGDIPMNLLIDDNPQTHNTHELSTRF